MPNTEEQIFAAAEEIIAGGKRPTLVSIRGATGASYSAIAAGLNAWKVRQRRNNTSFDQPGSESIGGKLIELGVVLWVQALTLVDRHFVTEREALRETNADLLTLQNEATGLADRMREEIGQLQSRTVSAESAERTTRNEVSRLQGEIAALRERALVAEARIIETERHTTDLSAQLDQAHQKTNLAQKELSEQKRVNEDAIAERVRIQTELTTALGRIEAAEKSAQAELEQTAAKFEHLNEQLTAAQPERDQARQKASEALKKTAQSEDQTRAPQRQAAASPEPAVEQVVTRKARNRRPTTQRTAQESTPK